MVAVLGRLLGGRAVRVTGLGRNLTSALAHPIVLPRHLSLSRSLASSAAALPRPPSVLLSRPATLRQLCLQGVRGRCSSVLAAPLPAAAAAAAPIAQVAPRAVGWWLIGTSASVFAMVVVGGITRLTRSGLSMTDWRPHGKRWPRNAAEWDAEFDRWKQFPEYQRLYKGSGFALEDFKQIFFWEWFHRMMGRSIGIVYGAPLAYFALRGRIPRSLAPTLGLLLVMGGSQGLVGWWMVKSGLDQKKVDEIDGGIPTVSPYRLAAHLTAAFTIFSILLYTGLDVLQPRADAAIDALKPLQRRVKGLAVLVGVTAVTGAFVAGRQAGFAFNTFPLMEGRVIPEGYMELRPLYRNFFESVPSVQLHHRVLAVTTLTSVTGLWLQVQRMPLPPQLRLATDALLLAAWGQVTLGVATLVNCVPVHLGSAHQAGALTLFSVVLFTMHSARVPHAGRMVARMWWRAAPSPRPAV